MGRRCSYCLSPDLAEDRAYAQNGAIVCIRCVGAFLLLKEPPTGLPVPVSQSEDATVPAEVESTREDPRSETARILHERADPFDDGRERRAASYPSRVSRAAGAGPSMTFDGIAGPPEPERCLLCGDDSGRFRPYVMNPVRAVICPSCIDTAAAWLVHPHRH